MTDTFIWPVHNTASGTVEPRTTRTDFGDGYEQEVLLGLDPETQKWSVTTDAYVEEMRDVILQFIRDHWAVAFFWTPPLRTVAGYYKCRRYSPNAQGGGLWTVSLEFEKVGSL